MAKTPKRPLLPPGIALSRVFPNVFKNIGKEQLSPQEVQFFKSLETFYRACKSLLPPGHELTDQPNALYAYLSYPTHALRNLVVPALEDDYNHQRITPDTYEGIKKAFYIGYDSSQETPHSVRLGDTFEELYNKNTMSKALMLQALEEYFRNEPMSEETRKWCTEKIHEIQDRFFEDASFLCSIAKENLFPQFAKGELIYNTPILEKDADADAFTQALVSVLERYPNSVAVATGKPILASYALSIKKTITDAAPVFVRKILERDKELREKQEEKEDKARRKAEKEAAKRQALIDEEIRGKQLKAQTAANNPKEAPNASHENHENNGSVAAHPLNPPPAAAVKVTPKSLLREQSRSDGRKEALSASQHLCHTLKNNLEAIGFAVTASALIHQEYDIVVPVEGSKNDNADPHVFLRHLQDAKKTAEELWLEAETRKDNSANAGESGLSPLSMRPPDDEKTVQDDSNLPEGKQSIALADASLFRLMEEWKNPGDEESLPGFERIRKFTRLPNIKFIVPSYIAKLELQGRIPGGKKGYIQIDNPHPIKEPKKHHSYQDFVDFFSNATQIIADDEGNIRRIIEGADKNIIVWEGKKDRELFSTVARLSSKKQWKQLQKLRKNAGEQCIEAFLQTIPFKAPVIIIAHDGPYSNERDVYTTRYGYPVSIDNGPAFLVATACLDDPDLTVQSILNGINERRKKNGDNEEHFLVHFKMGRYDADKFGTSYQPEHLRQIVQKGWNMQNGKHRSVDTAYTNGIATHQTTLPPADFYPAEKETPEKLSIEIHNEKDEPLGVYRLYATLHCEDKDILKQAHSFADAYLNMNEKPGDCRQR